MYAKLFKVYILLHKPYNIKKYLEARGLQNLKVINLKY